MECTVSVPVLVMTHVGRKTSSVIEDWSARVEGIPNQEVSDRVERAGWMYVSSRQSALLTRHLMSSLDDSIGQYLPEASPFLGLMTKARAWRPEGTKMEWIWKEAPRQIT
jgi:hypothetical protein